MNTEINSLISEIVHKLKVPHESCGKIDTCRTLFSLAKTNTWTSKEISLVDFFSKRVDVSRKLVSGYDSHGRPAPNSQGLEKGFLDLAAAILYKALVLELEKPDSQALQFKRFNVLFKVIDLFEVPWLGNGTPLRILLETKWASLLSLPASLSAQSEISVSKSSSEKKEHFAVLPLTVLFYEGPIARAYLETIYSLGFKPQKIIQLIAARDISTKKPIAKWLPTSFRKGVAAKIQREKIHYWPQTLLKKHKTLCDTILDSVASDLNFSKKVLNNANQLRELSSYSDHLETLLIDNIADKRLLQYLGSEPESAILFTGGGIVPANLLNIPHLKFIHIHPGYLPDIRGADCVLWSNLLTSHSSATCFYMSPGIDTGDIISAHWLPKINLSGISKDSDLITNYRAVFSFIDPWVRSFVLREVIRNNRSFYNLSSSPQSESEGVTYHFMHDRLREASICKMFIHEADFSTQDLKTA